MKIVHLYSIIWINSLLSGQHMYHSESLNTFDGKRTAFNAYGLTCELWVPSLMRKPDRHNEIEINYFPEGNITYLFQDKRITVPTQRLTIFWGLISHQIVNYQGKSPYYVCTIPFSQFLEWKLPVSFVDRILNGELLIESSEEYSTHDEFLLKNWIQDIKKEDSVDVILLEMHARLHRMANRNLHKKKNDYIPLQINKLSQVERIALYIAQNYSSPITVSDIGKAVGLHPDYANSIFKKAFGSTLSQYIIKERISHAQRRLVTTDHRVTEIAFECGFNSISSFNSAFQKINNCTPSVFRKKFQ